MLISSFRPNELASRAEARFANDLLQNPTKPAALARGHYHSY
jgi:hypothetical protein